ncbi:MAG: YCF48-related protein, partial [candidate division Zixibacteria bacterium]
MTTSTKRSLTIFVSLLSTILLVGTTAIAETWEEVATLTDENLTSICFVHPDTGYVVTNMGQIGRTVDGGQSWTYEQISGGIMLEDIHFTDDGIGLVCGREGLLMSTTDGGSNWNRALVPDTTGWFLSVMMLDSANGLALGMARTQPAPLMGISYRTTNAGQTWKKLEQRGMGYGELFRRDNGPVYFQSYGQLHMTKDGGAGWRTIETLDGPPGRATAIFGRTAVLVGNNGMIAVSSDNGKNWTDASSKKPSHLTSVV